MKAEGGTTGRFAKRIAKSENITTEFIKNKISESGSNDEREIYKELYKRNSSWPLRQYEWEQIVNRKVSEINHRNLRAKSLPQDRIEELLRIAEAKAEDIISFTDRQVNRQGFIYRTQVQLELDKLIAFELNLRQLKASDFPYPLQPKPEAERKPKPPPHQDRPRRAPGREPEIVSKMRLYKYLCLHPSGYNLEVVRVESDRVIVKAPNGTEMPVLFNRLGDYKWVRS